MRRAAFVGIAFLAGCATVYNPRSDPPDAMFQSPRGLNETAACLVSSLNGAFAGGRYTHRIDIIAPDSILEVVPQQQMVLTAEVYFVRVTATAAGSVIEPFVIASLRSRIVKASEACAA